MDDGAEHVLAHDSFIFRTEFKWIGLKSLVPVLERYILQEESSWEAISDASVNKRLDEPARRSDVSISDMEHTWRSCTGKPGTSVACTDEMAIIRCR